MSRPLSERTNLERVHGSSPNSGVCPAVLGVTVRTMERFTLLPFLPPHLLRVSKLCSRCLLGVGRIWFAQLSRPRAVSGQILGVSDVLADPNDSFHS